jgi:hypothetical protein
MGMVHIMGTDQTTIEVLINLSCLIRDLIMEVDLAIITEGIIMEVGLDTEGTIMEVGLVMEGIMDIIDYYISSIVLILSDIY